LQTQRYDRYGRSQIPRRYNRVNAGGLQRGGTINAAQQAVRDRAADNDGMDLAHAVDIADIAAAATQEARVLDTLDRAADEGVGDFHGAPCLSRYAARASSTASTIGI